MKLVALVDHYHGVPIVVVGFETWNANDSLLLGADQIYQIGGVYSLNERLTCRS